MAKLYNIQSHFIIIIIIITLLHSDPSSFGCVLDNIHAWNINSTCETRNWGGFIISDDTSLFEDYLYALSLRANHTKTLFLSPKQHNDCSVSDGCGSFLQNLTSGIGGCSDFTTDDVHEKLGDALENLELDCEQSCEACLGRWEKIVATSLPIATESERNESVVCGFSVLITLIGSRAGDTDWIRALFECFGDQKSTTFLSAENEKQGSDGGRKSKAGLWILAGCTTGIIAFVIILLITVKLSDNSQQTTRDEKSCSKIPIKEVYSATNDLDLANFIGQGVAGKVYKGVLSDGRHVAVKRIVKDGHVDTFVREVTSLSHVRHPCLVALIGFSEAVDECFLVYELCRNGNLSEWLFGRDKALFWIQRLRIAIDTAEGLRYLHNYPQGCIVHRDIKPTNILVDDKFRGKLSDFGLSKVMDSGRSYVSSEVRGTLGYVDPEYRANRRVNPSGDVYSFGMVLFQLLSGRRAIDLNPTRFRLHQRKTVPECNDIDEFADPKLDREYSSEAFEIVLRLGLDCTGIRKQRPSMKQEVSTLEKALEISTRFTNPDKIYKI